MTHQEFIHRNTVFAWLAVFTGLVLLIPFVAMQLTEEVVWSLFDFVVMAVLLFGSGSGYVLISRMTPPKYRAAIAIAVIFALLYVWAELAVGIFFSLGS